MNPKDFLRISNSVIVNVHHIQPIRPALSAKFILLLNSGDRVDVTGTYGLFTPEDYLEYEQVYDEAFSGIKS